MKLCIDIGNTHIYGGVFEGFKLLNTFRYPSLKTVTADQFGLFLCSLLEAKNIKKTQISQIAIGSVVSNLDYSVRHACQKYLDLRPYFLKYESNFGFDIASNPIETGADLVAGCLAACEKYPEGNKIILDFGTATTISHVENINRRNRLSGVAILPGLKTSMQALSQNAEALFNIELKKPQGPVGVTTTDCVQSGLFYSQLGGAKAICDKIVEKSGAHKIIATGGFAKLFEDEGLFNAFEPHLVLEGLLFAMAKAF